MLQGERLTAYADPDEPPNEISNRERPGKITILVEKGFEDVEILYSYYSFLEAGYQVKVVGPEAGIV